MVAHGKRLSLVSFGFPGTGARCFCGVAIETPCAFSFIEGYGLVIFTATVRLLFLDFFGLVDLACRVRFT